MFKISKEIIKQLFKVKQNVYKIYRQVLEIVTLYQRWASFCSNEPDGLNTINILLVFFLQVIV